VVNGCAHLAVVAVELLLLGKSRPVHVHRVRGHGEEHVPFVHLEVARSLDSREHVGDGGDAEQVEATDDLRVHAVAREVLPAG